MTINIYCDADPDNPYDSIITLGDSEDLSIFNHYKADQIK